MDTEWMAKGKCRDLPPTTFFPSDGLGVQAAQRICADCPVSESCLEYALVNHIDHGVWVGGPSGTSTDPSSASCRPSRTLPTRALLHSNPAPDHGADRCFHAPSGAVGSGTDEA